MELPTIYPSASFLHVHKHFPVNINHGTTSVISSWVQQQQLSMNTTARSSRAANLQIMACHPLQIVLVKTGANLVEDVRQSSSCDLQRGAHESLAPHNIVLIPKKKKHDVSDTWQEEILSEETPRVFSGIITPERDATPVNCLCISTPTQLYIYIRAVLHQMRLACNIIIGHFTISQPFIRVDNNFFQLLKQQRDAYAALVYRMTGT